MATIKFDKQLFSTYAQKLRKEISLLENIELPSFKKWTIDWQQIQDLQKSAKTDKWNTLPVYKELLVNKNNPAIYYFLVDKKQSKYLFDLFLKNKNESSRLRIEQGVGAKDFRSISHVPKIFLESTCIYVGSRKKNIHERFKQHLGYASGRTGALHMASVFSSGKSIPKISFHYHILRPELVHLTEHIECVVQNQLKPFIGKNILGIKSKD